MSASSTAVEVELRHVGSTEQPVKLLRSRVLQGCNPYHRTSIIRQSFHLGSLADMRSGVLGEEFASAYLARFQDLQTFLPQNGITGAFVERLNSPDGIGFDELLLQAILIVEAALAFAQRDLEALSFATIENQGDKLNLVWECRDSKLSRAAADVALQGVLELLPPGWCRAGEEDENFDTMLQKLLQRGSRRRLSPATAVMRYGAKLRGLPCDVVARKRLIIGQGKYQRHYYASMTSSTSHAAQQISLNKAWTNTRLRELRLPVPWQIKVGSVEEAEEAVTKLGFPVVIKPLKGAKGRGVTAGLANMAGVQQAFESAHRSGSDVVVEQFMPGVDHRLLVIGGKFVAALVRRPPVVVGDGRSTVDMLVDALNADPGRDGFRLMKIAKDLEMERMLAEAGVAMSDVLAEGRTIALRATANVSRGGLPFDVTEQVHPDNREMAERAAKGVGLDVAGVDFVTTDISRSFREVGGAIIELNSKPGLDIHTWPHVDSARPYAGMVINVAGEVLNLHFSPESDGRIPTVVIVGTKGTSVTGRTLDTMLRAGGKTVALVLKSEAQVNGIPSALAGKTKSDALRSLFRDPEVEALVTTTSPHQAVKSGLGLDACRVSIIMDKDNGDDAMLFQNTIDILKRATTDCFVINARNRTALEQLHDASDRQVILVDDRFDTPRMRAHLRAGHAAVVTRVQEDGLRILLLSGNEILASVALESGPLPDETATQKRLVRATMYAIAAAYGTGVSPAKIMAAVTGASRSVPDVAAVHAGAEEQAAATQHSVLQWTG